MSGVFREGAEYWVYGTARRDLGGVSMAHPEVEPIPVEASLESEGCTAGTGIVPVYPLTSGITQKFLRGLVSAAMPEADRTEEILPEWLLAERKLAPACYALKNIHFPDDEHTLSAARYRLVYEELFLFQARMLYARKAADAYHGDGTFDRSSLSKVPSPCDEVSALFPFELTGAQSRAIEEIYRDMAGGAPMRRLLQGDVGSGKTAVAAAAAFFAANAGFQTAIMAPTEILAAQHYSEFCRIFEGAGIGVAFLASGLTGAQKRDEKKRILSGEAGIVIGTHALIEPDVVFKNLGLVVTDEQHRFGVRQRLRLREKGETPDTLVMTATPIPRTLALMLYADLDLSVLDEMPPGRKPVTTRFVNSAKRDDVYDFAERVMSKGGQIYVVAPMIGDGEDEGVDGFFADEADPLNSAEAGATETPLASALGIGAEMAGRFPHRRVAVLHGRMKSEDKEETMRRFSGGDVDMLVCTIVIEVGVNVPNANMMIIENAERFGLAGLHQLRGRVGRGAAKSYCVLISDADTELAVKRCETIAGETDGFKIAELDMELRGSGDLFGVRQHGLMGFKLADPAKHLEILKMANRDAQKMLAEDPGLSRPEHGPLRELIEEGYGSD